MKIPKEDVYYTIEDKTRGEIKVKGSRFIATAFPVQNKEDSLSKLDEVKAEFYDATHNCFAYRFGREGMEFRAADDGEPSGSAGKPILFTIKKYGVSDVLVVVTRFFGGTKLGVGGLARAYSEAAGEALKLIVKKPVYRTIPVKVFCTYEDINVIKRLVGDTAVSFEEDYRDAVEIIAYIPQTKVEYFTSQVTSATSGRAGTVLQHN